MKVTAQPRTFEFWLGRAGTGKTYACIHQVAKELQHQARGRPLLILVPEQASAQTEYELAVNCGLTGYTRARVINFSEMVREIFDATGQPPHAVVDEETRVLVLRQLIRRRRDDLKLLGTTSDLPGLAQSVAASLLEFQRYGWTPDDLQARLDAHEIKNNKQQMLQWKLHDLALLWRDYNAFLEERGLINDSTYLEMAAVRMAEYEPFDGAKLWIDGFASFSAQEQRLLEALLDKCESAAMVLTLDPAKLQRIPAQTRSSGVLADVYSEPDDELPIQRIGNERVFENIEETYRTMSARLHMIGWRAVDVEYPRPDHPTRFSSSPALQHLEAHVLTQLHPLPFSPDDWDEERRLFGEWPAGPLELIEAEDSRTEIESIARRIASICSRSDAGADCHLAGWAWSKIAVMTRKLETYAPLVREIFPRYGIPFFIDESRRIACHPLSRLLFAALKINLNGWQSNLVLDYLKSGLSSIHDPDQISRLESFAARARLTESDWKQPARESAVDSAKNALRDSWHDEPFLHECWRAAAEPLAELLRDLNAENSQPAVAIWNFLSRLKAAGRMELWIAQAAESGNQEMALIHQAVWKQTVALLDRLNDIGLSSASSEPDMNARLEILEIFETGLSTIRARLIPPTVEQVIVGQIDRSRTPEIEAIFIPGMNEGEFPRVHEEDAMLGDAERRELSEGGRQIGPDSRARFTQERFFAYIALTRASQYVCITRPLGNPRSRVFGPSSFFRMIQQAYPVAVQHIGRSIDPGDSRGLLLPSEWMRHLAQAYHAARTRDNPELLGRLLAGKHPLKVAFEESGAGRSFRKVAELAFASLEAPREAMIDPAVALQFWQESPNLSVTALETYGQCPFQFFAARMLRLERPRDPLPGPIELGRLRHFILDYLFNKLRGADHSLEWGTVEPEVAKRLIIEGAERALEVTLADEFGRDPITKAMVGLVTREMEYFVKALGVMGRRYGFAQVEAEYRFGRKYAQVELQAAPGVVFSLEGSVDRVDASIDRGRKRQLLLYDYKSTGKKICLERFVEGADLQLPAYAIALEKAYVSPDGSAPEVAGFFYWPLSIGFAPAEGDGSGWVEPATEPWFVKRQLEGAFIDEIARQLDTECDEGTAMAFKFHWTKQRKLHAGRGAWMERPVFRRFLEHVRTLMEQRAGQIVGGRIMIRPLRSRGELACDRCDYISLCRVQSLDSVPCRSLKKMPMAEFKARFTAVDGPVT